MKLYTFMNSAYVYCTPLEVGFTVPKVTSGPCVPDNLRGYSSTVNEVNFDPCIPKALRRKQLWAPV